MNIEKLMSWYQSHRSMYKELATGCGSVSELMLRLEIYGSKWSKWDWILFFNYLDFSRNFDKESGISYSYAQPAWTGLLQSPDTDSSSENLLLADIFHEIDEGSALDAVLTNKTVVMSLLDFVGALDKPQKHGVIFQKYGVLRLLSHVFKKFPSLWTMNWMFIRHKGKNGMGKTHRLAAMLPKMASRPEKYFESAAFMEDFILKYWNDSSECCDDCAK